MYMHELIPFPLAVGDLGTRLALTIVFFVAISAALRSRGTRGGLAGDSRGIPWAHCYAFI